MLDRILDSIERVGNKLPDPITLFLGLAVVVVIISAICSMLGVTAVNPADGSTVETFNLFSVAGIQYLWTNVITNFSGFAPLGMVLVAVIGSSVAEKSGFLVALMEHFLGGAKGWIVSMVVIFLGINLNIAGDAGFIILPPLAAILFMSIGRSPLLGLYVAFASVAAGFCANILLGLSDALAYGFTESAAQMIDPNYSASMAINWYFLIASCLVLTVAGTILVEKVMVHRFPMTKEQPLNTILMKMRPILPQSRKRTSYGGAGRVDLCDCTAAFIIAGFRPDCYFGRRGRFHYRRQFAFYKRNCIFRYSGSDDSWYCLRRDHRKIQE